MAAELQKSSLYGVDRICVHSCPLSHLTLVIPGSPVRHVAINFRLFAYEWCHTSQRLGKQIGLRLQIKLVEERL